MSGIQQLNTIWKSSFERTTSFYSSDGAMKYFRFKITLNLTYPDIF